MDGSASSSTWMQNQHSSNYTDPDTSYSPPFCIHSMPGPSEDQQFPPSSRAKSRLFSSSDHTALVLQRNPAYTHLLEMHSELMAGYSELQYNFHTLAMAIPQTFHVIPNPYQIPVPTSSVSGSHANSPPSLCKSDYPNVLNWDPKDHSADSDLTRISDDDDDTPSDSKLDFLVHKASKKSKPLVTPQVFGWIRTSVIRNDVDEDLLTQDEHPISAHDSNS
ncbi:hypothetical protein B0H11DRAFT_1917483 [Mycena galericulata]|nr:hypothetical protein B0H11DRAFT_1917483 [Mycena galericulata]